MVFVILITVLLVFRALAHISVGRSAIYVKSDLRPDSRSLRQGRLLYIYGKKISRLSSMSAAGKSVSHPAVCARYAKKRLLNPGVALVNAIFALTISLIDIFSKISETTLTRRGRKSNALQQSAKTIDAYVKV